MPSNDYHFITHWKIKANINDVYDLLADAKNLPRWWGSVYLRVDVLEPGDASGLNKVCRLFTKGWLPYRLHWDFRVTEANRPHGFRIEAWGDFVGTGVWKFVQDGKYVHVRFDWKIRADKPLLKYLSFAFKPIFNANHAWAMRQGERAIAQELER